MRKIIMLGCLLLGMMLGGCSNPTEIITESSPQSASDSSTSAVEISSESHEGC